MKPLELAKDDDIEKECTPLGNAGADRSLETMKKQAKEPKGSEFVWVSNVSQAPSSYRLRELTNIPDQPRLEVNKRTWFL